MKRLDRPDRFELPEWETLCGEAARLGVALARFDRALRAYKVARDAPSTGDVECNRDLQPGCNPTFPTGPH